MPVPKSNLQPEIRAPQVATGKALDLTPAALNMQKELNARGQVMATGVRGLGDLYKAQADYKYQQEMQAKITAGFDALNEYTQKLVDRNAAMANWGPDEYHLPSAPGSKITRWQDYVNKVNEDFTTFVNKVNEIQDPTIKNTLLQNAHRINLTNRQNFTKALDQSNRQRMINSATAANDSLMAAATSSLPDPNNFAGGSLSPAYNQAISDSFVDASTVLNENTATIFRAQGIYNGPLIDSYARKQNEQLMDMYISQINSSNTSNAPWQESAPGKALVESMQKDHLITDAYAYKQMNRMEGEDVAVEVMMRPKQFVDKNGNFMQSTRNKFAPHMTHYEYDRIAKNAEEAAANIDTANEARLAKGLMDGVYGMDLNWQLNTGIVSKRTVDNMLKVMNMSEKEFWESDIGKKLAEKRKKTLAERPYEIGEHIKNLIDAQDKPYLYDAEKGKIVQEDLEGAALVLAEQKTKENPNLVIRRPLQNNSDLENMIENYKILGHVSQIAFDPKTTARMGRTWSHPGRPPANAIIYNRIWSTFNNASKYTGEIPYTVVMDLYRKTNDALQRGIIIPGEGEVNGKQLERRLHLDGNLAVKDRRAIELIDEAIQIVAAENLPHQTYEAMYSKATEYYNDKHARWTADTDWQKEPELGWATLFNKPGDMYFDIFAGEARKAKVTDYIPLTPLNPRRIGSDAVGSLKKWLDEPQMSYNEQEIIESLYAPGYMSRKQLHKYDGPIPKKEGQKLKSQL